MRNQLIGFVLAVLSSAPVLANVTDLAKSSGIQGGIIVHLGCSDGRETAPLLLNDRYLVHGLDADAAKVRAARKNLQKLKLNGKVSVSEFDGHHLPYTENLINLLIDSTDGTVATTEILRVLVPGGVAFTGGKKIVKRWPVEIDEWTHFLHGPDNNAVARDRRVDIPRSIQWVSSPRWCRSHEEMASMSAAVSAHGRIYYIIDEAPLASIRFQSHWKLVARDAFNGTLLWKKPISSWNDQLRHFRSGPTHLPRRLVAVGEEVYVTLGFTKPVIAIDGATGQILREYKGTERTEEILLDHGVLYLVVGTSEVNRHGGGLFERGEPKPTNFRYITAIDAESGKPIWKKDFSKDEYLLPLTVAVRRPHVYCQSSFGVVCLDAQSGQEVWKTPRKTLAKRMAFSAPTLVATDEVILCADRDLGKGDEGKPAAGTVEWGVNGWNESGFARKGSNTLRAYSATDGYELWSAECKEGYNSPVDVFVIGGTVWVGTDFRGYDLKTGEPKGQINTTAPRVGMPHHRCYRDKASERFIFTGKSGIEVLSLDKGWLSNNSWVRGTCQYGIMPANGFLYAPPDACACFLTVKAPGFFAAAPRRESSGQMPFPDQPVLEKGPLYGKPVPDDTAQADDWSMYRHDAARSSVTLSTIPDMVKPRWNAKLGGRLTQPMIAGGKVFVASIDAHTLHTLANDTGRDLWQFTAGGRIDSAPTFYKGRVIFGSADGWVYCLSAADGTLVWRFRAAPQERLISAYGQLESVWPVHGAVLIQNDTLYVTAGRSSYLDDGIALYCIDPVTGNELAKTVVCQLDPKTGNQLVPEARFNMEGTTADILSGDGERVYLKYFAFDRSGNRADDGQPHLFSITGLLGEEWYVRSYWTLSDGMPGAGWGGWANAAHAYPFGRILCFNADTVYGYGRQTVSAGPVGHRADAYHLFSMSRKPIVAPQIRSEQRQAGRKRRSGAKSKKPTLPEPIWSDAKSLIVRAMAASQDRLVVAGPVDVGEKNPDLLAFENEADALAGFRGDKGVFLRVVRAADGKTVSERKLTSMPVFDGLAIASGKVYVSLRNGSVICFGE